MSANITSSKLTAVREMTAAMRTAAAESRWREVQRIDDARAKLLRSIPAGDFTRDDQDTREILKDALAATREVEHLIAAARDEVASQLKEVHQRHSVARAYRACA